MFHLYNPWIIHFACWEICYESECCEKIGQPKPSQLYVSCDQPIRYVKLLTEQSLYAQSKEDCEGEQRKREAFLVLAVAQKRFVVSLVRPVGTAWGDCRCSLVICFSQSKFRNEATGPGAAETATSSMGSGVSESHGRWGIKFCFHHSGVVVSWRRAATLFHPGVHLSSSSSASICVTLG